MTTARVLAVSVLTLLSGCAAAPALLTGVGAASVVTTETTGRGLTDHAISTARDQDCRIGRVLRDRPVCQDPAQADITVTTTHTRSSTTEEIQKQYSR